jgi:hypothetical protein
MNRGVRDERGIGGSRPWSVERPAWLCGARRRSRCLSAWAERSFALLLQVSRFAQASCVAGRRLDKDKRPGS